MPAVEGYRSILNLVFTVAGIDLAVNWVFSRDEESCLPREIKPPNEIVPGSEEPYLSTI